LSPVPNSGRQNRKRRRPKWGLLLAVVEGNDCTDPAASNGTTSGALHAKVFRLRREIA
jgi:hypothetical protein